jgi:hypothetical protein
LSLAYRSARRFAKEYNLPFPVDEDSLDDALKAEGLSITEAPVTLPMREFRQGKVIGIRIDQPSRWRLWLKAHALGHYLMHRGDQDKFADGVVVDKQEHQADLFAGYLLIGSCWTGESMGDIASNRGVPHECVERWLEMARSANESPYY